MQWMVKMASMLPGVVRLITYAAAAAAARTLRILTGLVWFSTLQNNYAM